MCTSFTYQTRQGANALARTLDFSIVLDWNAMFMPRNYSWDGFVDGVKLEGNYAFVGCGFEYEGLYAFCDGVNEKGLSCAVLYFAGYARYNKETSKDKINLAPHEMVLWMLSNCTSVSEVKEALSKLAIIDIAVPIINDTLPFHWIVTDKSGATIVIEPREDGVHVYDNPLGIMSNSPEFPWHMTNVRNYIGIRPHQSTPVKLQGEEFAAFGQGSGTVGLPGDYTPPSRFLRALYGKETVVHGLTPEEELNEIFHVLFTVDIPMGSVVAQAGTDYTQYSSAMFCDSSTYYFKTYFNSQIHKIDLFQQDLEAKEPKKWLLPKRQEVVPFGI